MTVSSSAASRTLAVIGPGGVLAVADRDDVRAADQADGGLQPDDAVDRGRAGDRTVGLGPDREADQAGRDRRAAAARDSAGIAVERPGIARLAADGAPAGDRLVRADVRPFAKLVLPRMTAPAARSRATSGASRLVTLLASARLPAVVGSGPAVSILSLISIGWPASGPPPLPDASTRRACSIAVGSSAMTEPSCGSIRWARAIACAVAVSAGP